MEEKAPTRQVGYRNPDGSTTYISHPKKWVNPANKTAEQVLLEISEAIDAQPLKKEDVEDSLDQACDILWRRFQDDNHVLYKAINHQIQYLREYDKQSSQVKKNSLLDDVAKKSKRCIKDYFETGDK